MQGRGKKYAFALSLAAFGMAGCAAGNPLAKLFAGAAGAGTGSSLVSNGGVNEGSGGTTAVITSGTSPLDMTASNNSVYSTESLYGVQSTTSSGSTSTTSSGSTSTTSSGSTSTTMSGSTSTTMSGSTSTTTSGSTSTTTSGSTTGGQPSSASYSHVYVTFNQLQVHYDGAASPTDTTVATASDTDAGWVTVPMASGSTSETLDLMNLSQDSVLGNATLKNGTYTQIRMVVSSADVIDSTGATSSLDVSSGDLKIIKPFTLKPGYKTTLHFDFNTNHSIIDAGGTYRMNPTAVHTVPTYDALPSPSPAPTASPDASASASPSPSPSAT